MNAPDQRAAEIRLQQAMDWLIRLPDADAATREQFDTWLQASHENRQAFERVQHAWQSPLLSHAAAALEQRQASPARRRHWRRYTAAACVLLTLGATLLTDLPLRLRADHATSTGEQRDLSLSDGSRILLNTDTLLTSHIDDQQRQARLLRGEAYFEVTADAQRPFQIDAGPVRVSVRGTAFAVRYLRDEAEISVRHGEADLSTQRGDIRVSLNAGDSIRVGPDGFGERRRSSQQLAWVDGRLVFENCPLEKVLAELQRYYPGWILDQRAEPGSVRVTANYRLDDPLGAMRSLAQIAALDLHEYPHVLVLN